MFKTFISFIGISWCSSLFGQDILYRQSYNSSLSFSGKAPIYELKSQRDTVLRYFTGSHILALKSSSSNGKLNGEVVKYYSNGSVYELSRYDDGLRVDTVRRWHRNGNFMGLFVPTKEESLGDPALTRVITFYDSLGGQTVVNGKGNLFSVHPITFEYERGEVSNGFKDGSWEGGSVGRGHIFQEEYENGELVSGNSIDDEGNTYYYEQFEEEASFAGGLAVYDQFLSKNLRYPKKAQRQGVQGEVSVYFIVEKDGSLTNIQVVNGIGAGCDREAVRVMSLSPKWNPGKQRGQVVRQAMVQILNFKFK